jgi:FKBP-type peptidyl-prolyl cis-trans isomerase
VFAGVGAVVFLVTGSMFTIFVIMDMIKQKDSPKTPTSQTQTTPPTGVKLQGTQLAGFTPVESTETLQVTDTTVGTGDEAKAGQTLVVDYTGAVAATGKIFQSSLDTGQPATLSLDQVIEGWKEGIPGMKVGGVRRLVIPAAKAYGETPPDGSGIPANADLVFDITLKGVK